MMNKEKNFVSAVIYVHNAENTIEPFLGMIIEQLEKNFEKSEIICVNDFSDDSSVEVIKKVSEKVKYTTLTVLNMSYFHGLEIAMNAGVDLAIGDFVLEFDSAVWDFTPEEIMSIYYKALEGYDIVNAVPDKKQRLTSKLFYKCFIHYADFSYKFETERFRILSRRVINRISSMNKTIPYRKAVYAHSGLKMISVRYKISNFGADISITDKMEKRYRRTLAVNSLILFTEVGYRFSMGITVLMMIMALFMLVYSVIVYSMSKPVEGWTTTILFLSIAFFALFAILTIIVKYLQILIELVFKRTNYSFESIEKIR